MESELAYRELKVRKNYEKLRGLRDKDRIIFLFTCLTFSEVKVSEFKKELKKSNIKLHSTKSAALLHTLGQNCSCFCTGPTYVGTCELKDLDQVSFKVDEKDFYLTGVIYDNIIFNPSLLQHLSSHDKPSARSKVAFQVSLSLYILHGYLKFYSGPFSGDV